MNSIFPVDQIRLFNLLYHSCNGIVLLAVKGILLIKEMCEFKNNKCNKEKINTRQCTGMYQNLLNSTDYYNTGIGFR